GPLKLSQLIIPLMKKNHYGRIINISSGLGSLSEMGPGYPAYRISKASLNAVTRILAAETEGSNILVNSMCPGWVKSDMGGANATRSLEQGAETAVWLAGMPDGSASGKFFRDKQEVAW
ncbi:MAG: SDR family NAD(P)-dependent oxidoreductase, partial [Cytophagaceae bacterium]